tara:strand:+ start:426 stop:1034 length:609 start_codon:yes stop_codon:yes gene_type:complete
LAATNNSAGIDRQPLGGRIATLRKIRGLNLKEVAKVCGFSQATLSRIETGQTDISAHHLFLLTSLLEVDISDFFRNDAEPLSKGIRSITRAGDAEERLMSRYMSEILNSDLSRKNMHPAINHITAKSLDEVDGLWAHKGEEFLYVLSGKIVIHTELYAPTVLNTGDSMYFEGSMKHAYLKLGAAVAKILVIVGRKDRGDQAE